MVHTKSHRYTYKYIKIINLLKIQFNPHTTIKQTTIKVEAEPGVQGKFRLYDTVLCVVCVCAHAKH